MASTPPTFPPPEPPSGPEPGSGTTSWSPPPTDDGEPTEHGPAHRTRRVAVGAAVLAGAALAGVVVVNATRSDDAPGSRSERSNSTTSADDSGSLTPLVPSSGTGDGVLDPGQLEPDGGPSGLGEWDDGALPGGPPDDEFRPGHPDRGLPGEANDTFGEPPGSVSDLGELPPPPSDDTSLQQGRSSTGAMPAAPSGSADASTRGS